jgi:hypothetical protein
MFELVFILGFGFNTIIALMISYYSFRIARIEKKNILMLVPKSRKLQNDLKVLLAVILLALMASASRIIMISVYGEVPFIVEAIFPTIILPRMISLVALLILIFRWEGIMRWKSD